MLYDSCNSGGTATIEGAVGDSYRTISPEDLDLGKGVLRRIGDELKAPLVAATTIYTGYRNSRQHSAYVSRGRLITYDVLSSLENLVRRGRLYVRDN